MLELIGVRKTYGHDVIFDGIDGTFPRGSVSLLMGPNGVGKTTLVRCILGLEPHEGVVLWGGRAMDPRDRHAFPVFDDTPFHPGLTGAQNLRILAPESLAGPYRYLDDHVLKRKVKQYSYGQRKRLALSAALNSSADLIVLDEPTNGLDVDTMTTLREDINGLREQKTFLVTGHHLEFYEDLVDHVFVFHGGRLLEITGEQRTRGKGGLTDVYAAHYPRARR